MKNFFLEKNIVQKLIIAIVFIILFNFASPVACQAKSWSLDGGGELLQPIMELVMRIFDGALSLLQNNLMTDISILQPATSKEMRDVNWGAIIVGALLVVVTIIAVVTVVGVIAEVSAGVAAAASAGTMATLGAIATGLASSGGTILLGIAVAGGAAVGATVCGITTYKDFKGDFDVPTIVYTPFAIFSGQVSLFDINFFNPNSMDYKVYNLAEVYESDQKIDSTLEGEENISSPSDGLITNIDKNEEEYSNVDGDGQTIDFTDLAINSEGKIYSEDADEQYGSGDQNGPYSDMQAYRQANVLWSMNVVINMTSKMMLYTSRVWKNDQGSVDSNFEDATNKIQSWIDEGYIGYSYYATEYAIKEYTKYDGYGIDSEHSTYREIIWGYYRTGKPAEELWKDRVSKLWTRVHVGDIDEIDQATYGRLIEEVTEVYYELVELEDTYEDQYNTTQTYENFSVAKELQDTVASWYYNLRNLSLVALLVILLYIGIRIIISSTAPEKAKYKQMIINWVAAIFILFLLHVIMVSVLYVTETITKGLADNCTDNILVQLPNDTKLKGDDGKYKKINPDGESAYVNTNFIGYVRYVAGINGQLDDSSSLKGIGYILMYIMLVVQTCMFTWVYGKRVVYMAFLTIIAPLVAITYPIDKIGDGKAQAFDMWLKEYIFNALLQPVHLLIYTVLCGTAMELMINSPIYGIIALAFMVPAEKFIRKMFGFEKAQTPSALGGAAGAALAMSGIQRLQGLIRPDGKEDREADKKPKSVRMRTANADEQKQLSEDAEAGKKAARSSAQSSNIRQARNPQMQGVDESDNVDVGTPGTGAQSPGMPGIDIPDDGNAPSSPQMPGVDVPDIGDDSNAGIRMAGTGTAQTPDPQIAANNAAQQQAVNQVARQAAQQQANEKQNLAERMAQQAENAESRYSNENDPRKFSRRFKRAIGENFDYRRRKFEAATTPRKMAKYRRKIRRAGAGALLGASAGLTMAAIKMATGANASDVMTTSIAAGTAGYGIGSKGVQKVQEIEDLDNIREARRAGFLTSEESRNRINEQAKKEWLRDRDNIDAFRDAYGDDYKNIMESALVDKFLRHGVQDPEKIIAARDWMNSDSFQETFGHSNISEAQREAIAIETAKLAGATKDSRLDSKAEAEQLKLYENQLWGDESYMQFAEQSAAAQIQMEEANRQAAVAQQNVATQAYNERVQYADEHPEEFGTDFLEKNNEVRTARKELEEANERYQRDLKDAVAAKSKQVSDRELEIIKTNRENKQYQQEYNKKISEKLRDNPEMQRRMKQINEDLAEARKNHAIEETVKNLEEQKKEIERTLIQDDDTLKALDQKLKETEGRLQQQKDNLNTLKNSKITVQDNEQRQAELQSLKQIVENKESERATLLKQKLKPESDAVKAAKTAVKNAKVHTVDELVKEAVKTGAKEKLGLVNELRDIEDLRHG